MVMELCSFVPPIVALLLVTMMMLSGLYYAATGSLYLLLITCTVLTGAVTYLAIDNRLPFQGGSLMAAGLAIIVAFCFGGMVIGAYSRRVRKAQP